MHCLHLRYNKADVNYIQHIHRVWSWSGHLAMKGEPEVVRGLSVKSDTLNASAETGLNLTLNHWRKLHLHEAYLSSTQLYEPKDSLHCFV